MVDDLRDLGFLEDQALETLSQSNNNLEVTVDILMQPLDNTTTRVCFDESVRFDENVRQDETRFRQGLLLYHNLWTLIVTSSPLCSIKSPTHSRISRIP